MSKEKIRKRRKNRREKRKIRAYLYFNKLLRITVGRYLLKKFNVKSKNRGLVIHTPPPYLILPNHCSFFDPFIINALVPHQIYYVTSDATFRSPLLNFALGLVGAIPKTKAVSDLETVRHIMNIRRRRGVIGVFPEGQSSWDGHTLPLIYSTAKLVKLLKVPVIVPIVHGSFFSRGRWTRGPRKGKITIHFHKGISPEECKKLSVDQLYEKMNSLLEYDEYEYQKNVMVPFHGRKPAENLEQTLFACPHCKEIGGLKSRNDLFYCKSCHHRVKYNVYGFFEQRSESFYFKTIRDWNLWQTEYLYSFLKDRHRRQSPDALFTDTKAFVRTGFRTDPLKKLDFGRIALYIDRVEIHPEHHERRLLRTKIFDIRKIAGINVQNNEALEFYYGDVLFRLDFFRRRVSSYKWMLSVNFLQNLIK